MRATYEMHHDLVERCKQADAKAQFELYRLYSGAVYSTCLRIIGRAAEAEDLMQDVFLKAFSKMASFKGEQSFGSWIKRIAINHAIDSIRVKKIQFKEVDAEKINCADEDEMIDEVEFEQRILEIKNKILDLDEGYRLVLSLNLIEGLSHDEIGKMLGISASTSRSQLSRAKKKLLDSLSLNKVSK